MLELSDVRSWYIDQGRIVLNNATSNERFHTQMVVLDSQTLEIAPGEDQRPEILVDGLEKRLCGCVLQASRADMLITTISVDTDIIHQIAIASGTEGFDRKDVAFSHALACLSLDERDLLVAMNLVAQNVMASDVLDCFHRNGLAIEFDLVTFHHFLDVPADLVNPGVYAGLLQ